MDRLRAQPHQHGRGGSVLMDSQSPSLQSMQAVVDLFNQGRYGEAEVLLRDLT